MNKNIKSKNVREVLSFRIYSLCVFACVALILRQGDLAEIDCNWVLCFDTSEYYGESVVELELAVD